MLSRRQILYIEQSSHCWNTSTCDNVRHLHETQVIAAASTYVDVSVCHSLKATEVTTAANLGLVSPAENESYRIGLFFFFLFFF